VNVLYVSVKVDPVNKPSSKGAVKGLFEILNELASNGEKEPTVVPAVKEPEE
jgi:hypothetical protein